MKSGRLLLGDVGSLVRLLLRYGVSYRIMLTGMFIGHFTLSIMPIVLFGTLSAALCAFEGLYIMLKLLGKLLSLG